MLLKKLRKELLGKGQLRKYLAYAIGEILIVVSGILLAVQLNNWNEQQKNKRQVENIHRILISDIQQDIREIDVLQDYYKARQPLFKQILLDSMTAEGLTNCNSCPSLISTYNPISLNKKGYNLLKNQVDFDEADTLNTYILDLYNSLTPLIETNQKQIRDDVLNNLNYWKENAPWFHNIFLGKQDSRFAEYILSDPDYKNRAALHYTLVYQNHIQIIKLFKAEIEKIHKALEKLYGKSQTKSNE